MKRQQIDLISQYQNLIDFVQSHARDCSSEEVTSALRALSLAQELLQGKFLKSDLEVAAFLLDRYCLKKPTSPSIFLHKVGLLARSTETICLRLLR